MGADKRKELEERIAKAEGAEEVKAILAESDVEVSSEEAEGILKRAEAAYRPDGAFLSEDELDAVAGGVTERDWLTQGCDATVEEGSSCWGTDGGCSYLNIDYKNLPAVTCPSCGKFGGFVDKEESRLHNQQFHEYKYRYTYHCHYCGHVWQKIMLKVESGRG